MITANKTIDDKGKYAYPTDPKRFFNNDNGARYGRVDLARALTVSSDVYFYTIGGDLYFRQKHSLPERQRAAGHRPRVRVRQGHGHRAARTRRAAACRTRRGRRRSTRRTRPRSRIPDWLPGDNIQSAVGQGDMLVTPLQLANAYATFANGGTLHEPRLASEVLDANGKKVRDLAPITTAAGRRCHDRDTMLAGFSRGGI